MGQNALASHSWMRRVRVSMQGARAVVGAHALECWAQEAPYERLSLAQRKTGAVAGLAQKIADAPEGAEARHAREMKGLLGELCGEAASGQKDWSWP